MKIAFFATPDIAIESFKYFIESKDYEVCALVTQPPKPSNRGKKIVQFLNLKKSPKNLQ